MSPVRGAERGAVEVLLADVVAIAVVTSSQADGPADAALVRDLLGFMPAEARLTALAGVGLAPREASERLRITEGTAQTTLKRAFQNTGVTRQSELSAQPGSHGGSIGQGPSCLAHAEELSPWPMILFWGSCEGKDRRELYAPFRAAMLWIGARHAVSAGSGLPFARWVAEMQA